MTKESVGVDGRSILLQQNSERHRILLSASSDVYGRAKKVLALQICLTVGGAIVTSFLSAGWPGTKSWTVLYAVVVSLLDTFVLERVQAKCRKLGAQIQELFDIELFGLSWNGFAVGESPTTEEIVEHSNTFLERQPNASFLRDWYPADIGPLPLHYATLVCQRTNCWWDERLRRRYLWGIVATISVLATVLTAYGLARDLTFEKFLLTVLAPLWPALVWGMREAFKQHDAAVSAGKLRAQVEKLWERCLQSPLSTSDLSREVQLLQTEIFRGRSSRPLVFDWVHRLFRPRHQRLMQSGAAAMVARLQKWHEITAANGRGADQHVI